MAMTETASTPAAIDDVKENAAKRGSAWLGAVRRWGYICVIGPTLVLLLGGAFGSVWPFVLLTPMVGMVGVVLVFGIALLFASRRAADRFGPTRRGVLFVAVAALCWQQLTVWRLNPLSDAPPAAPLASSPTTKPFTVLSANVHTSNTNHAALIAMIEQRSPDVVVLMEIDSRWVESLNVLNGRYARRQVVPDDRGNFGIGVWTKLPDADLKLVLFKQEELQSLHDVPQVDAQLWLAGADGKRRSVRLIGLHPLPPISPGYASARDAVLAAVAESIAARPDVPTVVVGDLNATIHCRALQRLARRANLADAMPRIAWTWPDGLLGHVVGIRIDQVLVSPHWRIVDAHTGESIGSDHRPVLTTLELKQD